MANEGGYCYVGASVQSIEWLCSETYYAIISALFGISLGVRFWRLLHLAQQSYPRSRWDRPPCYYQKVSLWFNTGLQYLAAEVCWREERPDISAIAPGASEGGCSCGQGELAVNVSCRLTQDVNSVVTCAKRFCVGKIDMKLISNILEISVNKMSSFPGAHLH